LTAVPVELAIDAGRRSAHDLADAFILEAIDETTLLLPINLLNLGR
jgi:hypothetical protein